MGTPESWILCRECKHPTRSESALPYDGEYELDPSIKIRSWFCSQKCIDASVAARAARSDEAQHMGGNGTEP